MFTRHGRLRRDLPIKAWGIDIVLPRGTNVIKLKSQPNWAVESKALLKQLTGNTYDPEYRYLFVPTEEVIPDPLT